VLVIDGVFVKGNVVGIDDPDREYVGVIEYVTDGVCVIV